MNSYLIWIPSLQEYKRFKELTTAHQKLLSKLAEENLEFIYHLNNLLWELSVDELNINSLNLIDKYIICAYLRMRCIDTVVPLMISCPECGAEFEEKIDINNFIENNISILDRSYTQRVVCDDYALQCDIPIIGDEYNLLYILETNQIETNSVDNVYSYHTYSYIKSLEIKNSFFDLKDFSITDRVKILKEIPLKVIRMVQDKYMNPLFEQFNPVVFDVPCPTKKCKPFKFNLNLMSINDLIKLMFQESPVEILREIYFLSRFSHINSFYVESLTPKERTTMIKFIAEENKAKQQAAENAKGKGAGPALTIGSMQEHGFDLPESANNEFGF